MGWHSKVNCSNIVIKPYFTANGQNITELWRFHGFQYGGIDHFGFLKIQDFNKTYR